jgi:hypothetical protein
MRVDQAEWKKYISDLRKVSDKAVEEFEKFTISNGGYANISRTKLIDYAYALTQKYGEATAALSAEMYDSIATAQKVLVPAAIPAEPAGYSEVAKTVNGIIKNTGSEAVLNQSVGLLVKDAGQKTTIQNARRDHAEIAFYCSGDTCAYCITLAGQGWKPASKSQLDKDGEPAHLHANCDCTYAVRFNDSLKYDGYDPSEYAKMYYDAEGKTSKEKINSMRRKFYAENKAIVGTESSKADEFIKNLSDYEKTIMNSPTEMARLYKADGSEVDFGGVENHVIGDESVLKEMEGGVLTHNHPMDVTFSNNDIANGIVRGNLAELRAITSVGNLHSLINENASIDERRKFLAQFNERIKKYTNIAHDKIRRGERINQQEYVNNRLEQWLSENASQYHLKYTKTSL